jgi:hypothetical protein
MTTLWVEYETPKAASSEQKNQRILKMKIRILSTLGLVLIIAPLCLVPGEAINTAAQPVTHSSAPQSPSGYWYTETVDSAGWVGRYTSLALDGSNRPHISYCDDTHTALKYAWHDGTAWHIESVDSSGYMGGVTSLALDGSGRPHISYFYDLDLKYAWYDGASWHVETVDGDGVVGSDNSLALDGAGRPHISYHDDENTALKYAWHDGTAWHFEIVDSAGYTGWFTSLALDRSGRPHISYQDGDNDLKYARYDGSHWHLEKVDSPGSVGRNTSLALDASDHPHISYYDHTNSVLKYARYDGTDWHLETVDTTGHTEYARGSISLALDGSGHPCIGYYTVNNRNLKYARHDGTTWQIETVDSTGDVGWGASLALDELDQPHISYNDDSKDDLKYAHQGYPPPISLSKQSTPGNGLRNNGTLTYTLSLSGPSLNVRLWDPLPDNVQYITSSLTPPAVYSPTARAIVWQGTLPNDGAQVFSFQVTPGVTGTGSLLLSPPIVNTAWLTDTENDRSVSATVVVNGRLLYLPFIVRGH